MTLLKDTRKDRWLKDGIFLGLLLAVAAFLFWKCRYGVGNVDESFYLTVPYRLYRGDSLFIDEWHLSQMAGVLTLPVVSLYLAINQSTDGMILFMRYFCTLVQCLIAVVLYWRLRRFSWLGAMAAAVCFVLYIPFGIMALSYNSMGIMALVLCGALLLPGKKPRRSLYVLAGLCFAAAVLCCPYLILVYAGYVLAVAARLVVGKLRKQQPLSGLSPMRLPGALWFTAGAAVAAVAFVIFLLLRGSLGDMLSAFTHILNDPEHPPVTLLGKCVEYVKILLFVTRWNRWLYPLVAVLFVVCALDKNRRARRVLYFCLASLLTLALMAVHYRLNYINTLMWSVNVLGVFLLLLSEKKITRLLFLVFWVPGIAYSFCLNWASNQLFYAVSSASAVATVGTVMMLGVFAGELLAGKEKKPLRLGSLAAAAVLLAMQLIPQLQLRYESVFWEDGMSTQTIAVHDGMQAGLYVSQVQYDRYLSDKVCLAELKKLGGEQALFLSPDTRYYLYGEYALGTYSAWLSGVTPHTLSRLEAYYELNPDKLPDIIFIDVASKVVNEEIAMRIVKQLSDRYPYTWCEVHGGIAMTLQSP